MANTMLPQVQTMTLTDALREAALRKQRAEEERKRREREEMIKLEKQSAPAVATLLGGPGAGAATAAVIPLAEQIFRSLGGE